MTPVYSIENGNYVVRFGSLSNVIGPEVAILFDKTSNVVLQHGSPELVHPEAVQLRERLMEDGFGKFADDLVCVTGAFNLADLNKAVASPGVIGDLYHSLVSPKEAS